MRPRLTIQAPAKLNLYLRVVGRREDGYHLLESLMVKVDLSDHLMFEACGGGIRLDVRGADLPANEGNLVYRAAQAFYRAAGLSPGVSMVLEKRIPVAAGLGGGSSNAAATLNGLNELHGFPLGRQRLMEIGSGLGADVPFFLFGHNSAWAEGIGEILTTGPEIGERCFLLVNPGWPLSTAEVFKKFRLELTSNRRKIMISALNESSFTIDRVFHNDLEPVVFKQYPEVGELKDRLMQYGAEAALMTGSGPTVFGMFASDEAMSDAEYRVRSNGNIKWRTFCSRTLA